MTEWRGTVAHPSLLSLNNNPSGWDKYRPNDSTPQGHLLAFPSPSLMRFTSPAMGPSASKYCSKVGTEWDGPF
jgi:hypothetical protein